MKLEEVEVTNEVNGAMAPTTIEEQSTNFKATIIVLTFLLGLVIVMYVASTCYWKEVRKAAKVEARRSYTGPN